MTSHSDRYSVVSRAAKICLDVLRNYQGDYPKKAIVCCFLEEDKRIYDSLL